MVEEFRNRFDESNYCFLLLCFEKRDIFFMKTSGIISANKSATKKCTVAIGNMYDFLVITNYTPLLGKKTFKILTL